MMKRLMVLVLLMTVLWGKEGDCANKVPVPHTLVFAIGEWKPFISEEFEGYGPVVKLVDSLCEKAGFECFYEFMPWKRAWLSAQSGQVDGTFAWILSEKRAGEMHSIEKPLFEIPGAVFYRKDVFKNKPDITSYDSFIGKNYRVVDVRGYYSGQELMKRGVDVHIVNNDISRWKMMARGAMDITIHELPAAVEGKKYIPDFDEKIGTIILPNPKSYHIFYSRISEKHKKLPEKMKWLKKVMQETDFRVEGIEGL